MEELLAKLNKFGCDKELAIDEFLSSERDIKAKTFVLAIAHLNEVQMVNLLQHFIRYSKPEPKTILDIVKDSKSVCFEANDETYCYEGNFLTTDPIGNIIKVPMFKILGSIQLVELDLSLEVKRVF